MKTRIGILLGLLAVLGIWYVLSFTEWIRAEPIQIQAQVRDLPKGGAFQALRPGAGGTGAAGGARPGPGAAKPRAGGGGRRGGGGFGSGPEFEGQYPVVFALDGEYPLTSIRVIEAEPTGHAARIAWQANSTSNSAPTKAVIYGRVPRGMKLKDEREPAKKLEPGVLYRLELKAGRYSGSTTFRAKEQVAPEAP
ncbi:MAG: hypothetical protein DVB31_10945 [Verrucomicrobia bacterium]|nr:MAG: hypothetical protein DVB31_10945 [Verrucomicrobiota bacterium]